MASTSIRVVTARAAFTGPGMQANGLEAVPEGLWVCDQRNNLTYLVDYQGTPLQEIPTPARNASGVSFGSGWVWIASNTRPDMIYRHDPKTGRCTAGLHLPEADRPGVHGIQWRPYGPGDTVPPPPAPQPEQFPTAPGGKPNAGPGVSGTLWVTRPGALAIDQIDAETGELLRRIPFPAPRSHGCYWNEAGGTLTVAETNFGHVYTLDPATGAVLDHFRIEAEGGIEVHGLTRSADGRVWIADAASNLISVVEI